MDLTRLSASSLKIAVQPSRFGKVVGVRLLLLPVDQRPVIDPEAVREQVGRILRSPEFAAPQWEMFTPPATRDSSQPVG
jgi:hypothetical protein